MSMRDLSYQPNEIPEGRLTGSSQVGPIRYRPGRESGHARPNQRGYYGLPILKRPTWAGDVWAYFFMGGLAAGSFCIASLAELFGDSRDRLVSRLGYVLSFLALLFCPPLLVKDLGRPGRFLNMLRVVKPESPMSMGTWGLVGFSLFCTLAFFKAILDAAPSPLGGIGRALPGKLIAALGLPFGCFLGSYTGVLLSVTSIPVWSRGRLLGATFLASAFSSGAATITLALALGSPGEEMIHRLAPIERVAVLAEAAALGGYLYQANRAARPLLDPAELGIPFLAGTVGMGLAVPIVGGLLGPGRHGRGMAAALALAGLVGGLSLRYAFVESGQPSSQDNDAYLWMTDGPVS
jgi:formate-dependent nitrite reductase membrane component NrfD